MTSAEDRQHSFWRSQAPDPSQDVKTETSDRGTSEVLEACVKEEEMIELNVSNPGDNLHVSAEIFSVKVEDPNDKDNLYCEGCKSFFFNKCEVHGLPLFIPDTPVPTGVLGRAKQTLPAGLEIGKSSIPDAGLGVFNKDEAVPVGAHFGPYQGELVDRQEAMNSGYSWVMETRKYSVRDVIALLNDHGDDSDLCILLDDSDVENFQPDHQSDDSHDDTDDDSFLDSYDKLLSNVSAEQKNKGRTKDYGTKTNYTWQKRPCTPPDDVAFTSEENDPLPDDVDTRTPFNYFKQFVTDEMLEHVATETNRYSVEKLGLSIGTSAKEIEQLLFR